ncbi:MAG: hypothetical protein GY859_03275, partial [Desulfobacterales bacterium]|nr:hypothetical protein [Desulfobacterales bacterium]
FNCLNKAKAFWWMMARISGWDSECAAYFPDTGTVHIPYLEVDGQFFWVNFNVTQQGLVLDTTNYGLSKGTGSCAEWTGSAVQIDCVTLDASGATYSANLSPSGSVWVITPPRGRNKGNQLTLDMLLAK